MRQALLVFAQIAVLSLLVVLVGLLFPGKEYVHASTWEPNVPLSSSDYRPTRVWGSPLAFVTDHPYKPGVGKINAHDDFSLGALLFDYLLWFMVVATFYAFALLIVRGIKNLGGRKARPHQGNR